ncbi:translocase of outer membrane 7 [Amazona aestiva]|uniref:Mitochondrial import receptor subunit TOM7 homolog n=1 Tax=Amazona aestiva TaxID=12930 RepID=A0A0Q3PC24_AMAAE|nr:translocase of outer membrane 7 [Amazona aestiva]
MPKLSKETKQRLQQLFKGGQFAIRWGFIPVVLYLVYFGDEGNGGPVLEPADGQRKCLKMHIPEDGADTYTSWLNQLSNAIGCTYNKMEFLWT